MKYKLIKEYPGSPKLNTVINDEITTFGVSFAKNNLNSIENHSEFWQPVVEKDYEILYIIIPEGLGVVCNGTYNKIPAEKYKIHSVKRLSDDEIFTIGDRINNENYSHSLDEIILYNNEILLQHNFATWKTSHNLKDVQKYKQLLFTTEDGVDIFEDDSIYWVNINTFEKVNCNKYNDDLGEISIKSLLSKKYECKAVGFSTKEKAEEYILMNKPCLSLNDILSLEILESNSDIELLENLIKLKIKYNSPCKLWLNNI